MYLITLQNFKAFVICTPEELRQSAAHFSREHGLDEAEVAECIARVYQVWYDEELAKAHGSVELLERFSKLRGMENRQIALKYL